MTRSRSPADEGRLGAVILCATLFVAWLSASEFQAARLTTGTAPLAPSRTVGMLEFVLHLKIAASGSVDRILLLHAPEPLAGLLQRHLSQWRFASARKDGTRVSTSVLVAGIYRPPALFDLPKAADPPAAAQNSAHAPIPLSITSAAYPPRSVGDAVVIIEVSVDAGGNVIAANVVRPSGSAFDSSALQAARRWGFSPGSASARPTFAYLVFGFREPVAAAR